MGQVKTDARGPYRLAGPLKGVNSKVAQTKLGDGEWAMLRNVELNTDIGILSIVRGSKQLNPSSLGSFAIRGGIRWYFTPSGPKKTASETVFAHENKLYRLTGAATTPVQIGTATYSTDSDWFFIPYADTGLAEYLFCLTHGNAQQRHHGGAVDPRPMGFPAPGSAPTAGSGGAGVLTGAYKYKVTFVYDSLAHHESSASAVSNTFVAAANDVDLTAIPVGGASSGVTARNIYRTKAGGELFYFNQTVAGNVSTTATDNIADDGLGSGQAPTDNAIPPRAYVWTLMRGRLYAGNCVQENQARLRFSPVASTERNPSGTLSVHGAGPEIWPSTYFIDIGDDNGPINGLIPQSDSLVIFKSNEIYVLKDNGASDMGVFDTGNGVGCIAPRSVVDMGKHGIFFLGIEGTNPTVFTFKGGRVYPVSDPIQPSLKLAMVALGDTATVLPSAVRYGDLYLISYQRQVTPSVEYETAIFDTVLGRWMPQRRGPRPACWIPFEGPKDAGELYFGHADQGWIVRYDVDGGDFDHTAPTNPADMQMVAETGWLDFGNAHQLKQLKWVYVSAEVQTGATMTLERRMDFNTSGTTSGAVAEPMNASTTGTQVFAFRIESEQEGGDTPESAYVFKFILTVDAPYTATGEAFKPVKIHEVTAYYAETPPIESKN